jgi:hypothetical protein
MIKIDFVTELILLTVVGELNRTIRTQQCRFPTNPAMVTSLNRAMIYDVGVGKRHCRVLHHPIISDYIKQGRSIIWCRETALPCPLCPIINDYIKKG